MSYGPMSVANVTTSDIVSPGMPTFVALRQVDNSVIRATVALPVMDSNGGNLTGLTKLTVVSLPQTDGVNPFEGLSMSEALALPGVQAQDVSVAEADAGQETQVDMMVMNLGGSQAFAAACNDA